LLVATLLVGAARSLPAQAPAVRVGALVRLALDAEGGVMVVGRLRAADSGSVSVVAARREAEGRLEGAAVTRDGATAADSAVLTLPWTRVHALAVPRPADAAAVAPDSVLEDDVALRAGRTVAGGLGGMLGGLGAGMQVAILACNKGVNSCSVPAAVGGLVVGGVVGGVLGYRSVRPRWRVREPADPAGAWVPIEDPRHQVPAALLLPPGSSRPY
jgi:hypothetical protein